MVGVRSQARSQVRSQARPGTHESETLMLTLTTWFATPTGVTVSEGGALLFGHRNTIRNPRLRIEELTDGTCRSLGDPRATAELHIAAKAISLFGAGTLT